MSSTTGSVKRGAVALDLALERQKVGFDQNEMRVFLHGGEEKLRQWTRTMDTLGSDPELRNTFEFYDMTPHESHVDLWRRMKVLLEKHGNEYFKQDMFQPPYLDKFVYFQSSLPLTLHVSMFRTSIENLANEE